MSKEIDKTIKALSSVSVAVIGDVMLDRYWWGRASRISPEAPVPVVSLERVSHRPGGAANVAANIAALEAEAVLVGLVGRDEGAHLLRESLDGLRVSSACLVEGDGRPTTVKTRVMVHHQQIARVDDETADPPDELTEELLIDKLTEVISRVDCVVISDYAKGCVTPNVVRAVIEISKRHGRSVIVDPKSRDLTRYNGATILTPNLSEALAAAGIVGGEERADEAADILLKDLDVESILITLGEHGMKFFARGSGPVHFPSTARQVFDVTGAGDTVVAILAAALGAKADIHTAIELANIGAGLAVEKIGTCAVRPEELEHAINRGSSQFSDASRPL